MSFMDSNSLAVVTAKGEPLTPSLKLLSEISPNVPEILQMITIVAKTEPTARGSDRTI